MNNLLEFGVGNSKLGKNTLTFDLPAGHACPFAKECRSCVDLETGKIVDGPHTKYRCFGATSEARFKKTVLARHWRNYNLLKEAGLRSVKGMADLIDQSMPDNWIGLVRVHSTGGDFFNSNYFKAWCEVARRRPGQLTMYNGVKQILGTIFYAYSKAAPIVVRGLQSDNFKIVGSLGGTHDDVYEKHGYRTARVVFSQAEADELGLEVDHDDSHVWATDESFALLLHGTQPKGSDASKALQANKKLGWTGYNKNKEVTA